MSKNIICLHPCQNGLFTNNKTSFNLTDEKLVYYFVTFLLLLVKPNKFPFILCCEIIVFFIILPILAVISIVKMLVCSCLKSPNYHILILIKYINENRFLYITKGSIYTLSLVLQFLFSLTATVWIWSAHKG
jgi:hypothetical protein